MLALGAAGVTLAAVLAIVGGPVASVCAADPRGVVTCLRDMADRRFNLPGTIPSVAVAPVEPAEDATDVGPGSSGPEVTVAIPPVQEKTLPEASPEQPAEVVEADVEMGHGGPFVPAAMDKVVAPRPRPAELPTTRTASLPVPKADAHSAIVAPATAPSVTEQPHQLPAWKAPLPDFAVAPAEEAGGSGPAGPIETAVARPDYEVDAWEAPQPDFPSAVEVEDLASKPQSEPASEALASVHPAAEVAPWEAPLPPELAALAAPVVAEAAPEATAQAAGDAAVPEPAQPQVAVPVILAPTIDAIELDGARSYVSGSGPTGALVRLYVDGVLVGETPVEEGRWVVETGEILSVPKRELRAEAMDPKTGKSLGDTIITVEIELPAGPPEPPPAPPAGVAPPPPEPGRAPAPPPEASAVPQERVGRANKQAAAPDLAAAVPAVGPSAEQPAKPLPPVRTVAPDEESVSVDILPRPEAPALIASFRVPALKQGEAVSVIQLVPFGDPELGRFTGGKAIIREGDTLWSVAHRYYGAGIHYRTILKANRDLIRRASRIFPGQVLDLPLVTED